MASEPVPAGAEPTIIPRPDHNISRANISRNALKVMYRLRDGGFQAFLVGGGVRDLLLGREPKDFDIATDATPEQVRKLFRNCRLIGRRFRLAHVYFGREIVEVATFRGSELPGETRDDDGGFVKDEEGRLLRDNIYGSIDQDIWRRDFTANALYYNIADYSIWDYAEGVKDIRRGVLRLIGDPVERYREDPVRLLRAARFAAKLGFRLDPDTEAPIDDMAPLLASVPPARLFDETLKLFLSGHAVQSYESLRHYGLFGYLFPAADELLDSPDGDAFRALLLAGLANTDKRVAEDQPVTAVFLFCLLLWGPTRQLAADYQADGEPPVQALLFASDEIGDRQQEHVAIPRRVMTPAKEMMLMQLRMQRTRGKRVLGLLGHPRFRAAYDFLLLRAETGDEDPELASFWTQLQEMSPEEQAKAVGAGRSSSKGGRKRRRPRRRKPSGSTGH
ncbi:MAG: polynucleotide adenylyltransferase PcnB [Gammaproteobacteria bacterium]